MINRNLAAWGLAALVTAAIFGCGTKDPTTPPPNGSSGTNGTDKGGTTTPPPTPTGKKLTIGFSQVGSESGWRTANTISIQEAAKASGYDLKFSDAQQKQENQIAAIKNFITQGVDVIAFSPIVTQGWEPVLKEAKAAGIPVIVSDRRPDVSEDLYATFIGSDFVDEGKRAAEWLAKKTNGKAVIAEITGTTGSAPAIDRKKGFEDAMKAFSGMSIVISQTGDFKRENGKTVMEAFLKGAHGKEITAVFAHNDDMAIGAIQAIEEAGKKPGKDILVISIDSVKDGLTAITQGKLNCSVECNPLLGPMIMEAAAKVKAGQTLPKRTVVQDGLFDDTNAAKALPTRKY